MLVAPPPALMRCARTGAGNVGVTWAAADSGGGRPRRRRRRRAELGGGVDGAGVGCELGAGVVGAGVGEVVGDVGGLPCVVAKASARMVAATLRMVACACAVER